jgi:hypothetical protein
VRRVIWRDGVKENGVGRERSFMVEVRKAYKILAENLKGRNYFGGVDMRTVL